MSSTNADGEYGAFQDMNNAQHFLEKRIADNWLAPIFTDPHISIPPVPRPIGEAMSMNITGFTVSFKPGSIIFTPTPAAGQPQADNILHRSSAFPDIVVDAADGTDPRIDILAYKVEFDDIDTVGTDAEARNSQSAPVGATVSTKSVQNFDKRRRTKMTVEYVTGVADASPVAPTPSAGTTIFGRINVPAGAGSLDNFDIEDLRQPAGRTRFVVPLTSVFLDGVANGWSFANSGSIECDIAVGAVAEFPILSPTQTGFAFENPTHLRLSNLLILSAIGSTGKVEIFSHDNGIDTSDSLIADRSTQAEVGNLTIVQRELLGILANVGPFWYGGRSNPIPVASLEDRSLFLRVTSGNTIGSPPEQFVRGLIAEFWGI